MENLRGIDILDIIHVKHYRMRVVSFRRFGRMNEVCAVKFQLQIEFKQVRMSLRALK